MASEHRIGFGTDLHALREGARLVIGGVEIPSPRGAVGHSDADVLLHALADAILGAIAAGDIGVHFPDTDPANRGLDSAQIIAKVVAEAQRAGWRIGNVDLVVDLERPKLVPHRDAIRRRIASLVGVEVARVSLKAKTGEGFPPIGTGDAIGAQAIVLLER